LLRCMSLQLAHLPRSGGRANRVRLRYYIPRPGQTAGVPVDDPVRNSPSRLCETI